MDSLITNILGLHEHEAEGGKLRPETVIYLTPDQMPSEGAHCGACLFFRASTSECLLTDPAHCDAEDGVCACFIKGPSLFKEDMEPTLRLAKKQAGYAEDGPTNCERCEYWTGDGCRKVGGKIEADGCCNHFESDDEK